MEPPEGKNISFLIKEKAAGLGFDLCGFAPSGILSEHESRLKTWCSEGMNGDMAYLARNIEKRINPDFLVPGAKSIIVTGLNYYSERQQGGNGVPVISRYAYGTNYHDVIKEKLDLLIDFIKIQNPEAEARSFVDSAPLLEKAWAKEAGLGWPGRHSILINKSIGSFFFIGIIVVTIGLDYDTPHFEDHCGECRLCIESCPTSAINENRTIDVRKCIAYLTIESKTPATVAQAEKFEGRIFGCDKCQEVCPWNARAKQHKVAEFEISNEMKQMTIEDWLQLTPAKFKGLFKKSAIGRRKYHRFMETVELVSKNM